MGLEDKDVTISLELYHHNNLGLDTAKFLSKYLLNEPKFMNNKLVILNIFTRKRVG